ncbi:MAG: 50S ribosomal protein L4 [Candidatus Doudnabacteria bacterium RIFCSPLOWO2_02_FULL_42_9]|uniref:Large ribosomal subunit protein uL4 n=1 Tax=Candidatus Doudnabacteria bacterium RIFCSPHIGHO2_01_FULL_41_86 TaxID=1817821 RepID=A0A1F5N9G8_9BACT|nr:ribosomal protein L4 [uncultured bacterium]OGE74244.1 MAG: 50S ribosomal protein L4 [Candidatus Doudnabacteria bacterium RIFCSPHIGHO2_01_FULL_41_86]OGE75010.1 MAG: 50S ribosomal protein L4 [Candidatus Doudnabacteria bacterium RIFCSPHIGHO2_01_43_10]OGE85283.1 MAG: 50S ribosomal protein L4 [Candidatus Doudnabacteria bacterium RIFCSPHIGHO2_12_FULL_42_22]OGE86821.1 MAG: 50S ribosomal protein L4 [Candidatus Doudnabacteria bacterium RIFCSPHIGHO2_02_FULL_42_25]OGE92420.1 MAG: 50S ribosomal protein
MPKVVVYNQTGDKVTDLDLNPKIFGVEKIDANLVHSAVRIQLSNARSALAHTKNRGEVAGSGRKPWKQKGTGRARAGSIRSPIWRHGGITFGPRSDRNWSLKMNRSAWRKALFTILTDKLNDKKLVVLENLDKTAKTKEISKRLNDFATKAGLGKKYLVVMDAKNAELERAVRNLANVKILYANQLNVVDLMKYDVVVLKDALTVIEKTYGTSR